MKKKLTSLLALIVVIAAVLMGYTGDTDSDTAANTSAAVETSQTSTSSKSDKKDTKTSDSKDTDSDIEESGEYTSKEEVAEYIHLYGHLPDNYITKNEAKKLGWVSSKGNLSEVAPGKSIGGDHYGNYEGNLPEKKGRSYTECDIDSDGGYRGAKRIIFSNDGLIYYTEDHYETFELLYGEE